MAKARMTMRLTVDVYGSALDALHALEERHPRMSLSDLVRRALVEVNRRELLEPPK
jgi:hypothetical protein